MDDPGISGTIFISHRYQPFRTVLILIQSNPDMLDWKLRDRFCVKCRKSIRGSSGSSRSRCSCGETVICDGNNLEFILLCWNIRQKIATPETGKFYLRLGSKPN